MTTVEAYGLRVELPRSWEARLYRREPHPGASVNPVLHLANFPLTPGRGDFGTGAVERMGAEHVFVSLLEYDGEEAGRPLFAAPGVPRPRVGDFAPNALQRHIPGQLGGQWFFTEAGRPFCLYAVLGSRRHAEALVTQTEAVLDGLKVGSLPWA